MEKSQFSPAKQNLMRCWLIPTIYRVVSQTSWRSGEVTNTQKSEAIHMQVVVMPKSCPVGAVEDIGKKTRRS